MLLFLNVLLKESYHRMLSYHQKCITDYKKTAAQVFQSLIYIYVCVCVCVFNLLTLIYLLKNNIPK